MLIPVACTPSVGVLEGKTATAPVGATEQVGVPLTVVERVPVHVMLGVYSPYIDVGYALEDDNVRSDSKIKHYDSHSHNTSAPVTINNGCGHCAIAVDIGRRSIFSDIDVRIRDSSRSGTVTSLVHNEYHGFRCISCDNGELGPRYEIGVDNRIREGTVVGTIPRWRFRYC